jgi:hypothetical protein
MLPEETPVKASPEIPAFVRAPVISSSPAVVGDTTFRPINIWSGWMLVVATFVTDTEMVLTLTGLQCDLYPSSARYHWMPHYALCQVQVFLVQSIRINFWSLYAHARDIGLDCLADRADAVDRSRLTVDSLKWYLCKLAPKYGDKIDATLSGPEARRMAVSLIPLLAVADATATDTPQSL